MKTRLILAIALAAASANASVILSPGTVLSNTLGQFSSSTKIDLAIDQTGLSGSYTSGATPYATGTSLIGITSQAYQSAVGTMPGSIDFDLGGDFYLVGFALWNVHDTKAVNAFKVWSSPSNTFPSLTLIGSGNAARNVPSSNPGLPRNAQIFSFSNPMTTQFVRFEVESSHGASFVSFDELAFEADTAPPPIASTPEPSSFVLLMLGGLAFAIWMTRCRKKSNRSG